MVPWSDGRSRYTTRFHLDVISEEPSASEPWGVIQQRMHQQTTLQAPRRFDDPHDEAVLASYFPPESPVERMIHALVTSPQDDPVDTLDVDSLNEDTREFVERVVAARGGQRRYRMDLIAAYGGCAITGAQVEEALEAAHISPYTGDASNHVANGLLLRRDLHRLFDAHLLTVTSDYTVRVSPRLKGSDYWVFDQTELRLPPRPDHRPSPDLLGEHGAKCAWLDQ